MEAFTPALTLAAQVIPDQPLPIVVSQAVRQVKASLKLC